MKRFVAGLSAGLMFLAATVGANADYVVKDGNGTLQTIKAGTISGSFILPWSLLVDPTGAAIYTAPGTPNGSFAMPIQGVTGGFPVAVSGTFWQSTQPVSLASVPLPSGAATAANQATEISSLSTIASNTSNPLPAQSSTVPVGGVSLCDGANSTTNPCTTAATVKAASTATSTTDKALVVGISPNSPLPAFASTPTVNIGTAPTIAVTGTFWQSTQPVSLTSLPAFASTPTVNIGTAPTIAVTGTFWQSTQPVSAASLPLPSNAAQETGGNLAQTVTDLGAPGATACSTDTGSCSVNALLQRIAQRITSLIGSLITTTDAADGSTGSAVPSKAIYAGAVSSGNLTGIIQADTSAPINVSTATTTQLVALSSGKKIYVTFLDIIAGGTGNITFEYGSGTNCGTGTTALTGAYNLAAQTRLTKGGGLGPVLVVPSGNALCALTSAAVQMSGSLAYTQF